MAQNVELIAPNEKDEIQRTMDEHPDIDTMDEEARGEIVSITAARLNAHRDRPWGRKARTNNPSDPQLNTDGMTYLRPDGLFEIIDVISGSDGSATWDECGAFAPGENGYFYPVPGDAMGSGGDDLAAITARLEAVEQVNADQQAAIADLTMRLATLETAAAQPFHCHGPVDLPIVLESLTRLRAKGDIDVEVKSGQAVPPPVSTGEPPSFVDAVLLKRLLDRLRPEEEA
jgi:hypothetical protein